MVKIFAVPQFGASTFKGWFFVLVAGVVLAILALIDRGGIDEVTGSTTTTTATGVTGCQLEVATDQLNVRAGPSQNAEMLEILTRGDQVDGTAVIVDGYRQLGERRWVMDQWLTPLPGSNCS